MIVIVDYNMGNLFSVEKRFKHLRTEVTISCDPKLILNADKLILPGVGHFGKAMDQLKKLELLAPLNEAVLEQKKPVLGICLGMQLMTLGSEEGGTEGLGWFDCETERLSVSDPYTYKIPHTGWNTIEHNETDAILKNVPSGSEVYFVHAYGVLKANPTTILTTTIYSNQFVSALRHNNIYGMQFHPEKSLDTGEQIFKNFISL